MKSFASVALFFVTTNLSLSSFASGSVCGSLFVPTPTDVVVQSASGRAVLESSAVFFNVDVLSESAQRQRIINFNDRAVNLELRPQTQFVRISGPGSTEGTKPLEFAVPSEILARHSSKTIVDTYVASEGGPRKVVVTNESFDGEKLTIEISESTLSTKVVTTLELGVQIINANQISFSSIYLTSSDPSLPSAFIRLQSSIELNRGK